MSHSSVGISWLFSSANYALDYIFSMNNGGSTKRNCSIKSYKIMQNVKYNEKSITLFN